MLVHRLPSLSGVDTLNHVQRKKIELEKLKASEK